MSTSKKVANVNPVIRGLAIAKEEYTLSNVFNKLSKKTASEDNYILKGWNVVKSAIQEDTNNDVTKYILQADKGYVLFTNHFAKKYWDNERKTAVKGKTWNLYTNVVTNKGKCSVFFVYRALAKLSKMDSNEFNEILNFGAAHKPVSKEVAAS